MSVVNQPAKTLSILGVTGSIGQSAADVVLSRPEAFDVQVLSAHCNVEKLAEMAVKLGAKIAVIADERYGDALRQVLDGSGVEALAGGDALNDAAARPVDLTLAGIMGVAGLEPVMRAINGSKVVAIANKEPLVAAGPLVLGAAREKGVTILPVDSEHNAIFQVFDFAQRASIKRIILTASGGPFRTWAAEDIARATPAQALAHPNWSMGQKISIDSASMMNKALEIIEAHYLFDMPPEQIDVLIHPQSVVHSMVEYADGSVLAQMGASDMRTPIAYALGWPDRIQTPGKTLDFAALSRLDFEMPDTERFPALARAYECLRSGEGACVTLNAANEVAVEAFLSEKIAFSAIMDVIDFTLDAIEGYTPSDIASVVALDETAKAKAREYIVSAPLQRKVI
ncbi:MAG: 1-deoxy-D-xylulose-5-phosphate reductoisomerase [Alphaproteobacteria bacterium]|nr:1-deoxy-D-xylulose-5-phosphate reductoisomerase [Alphaproteobacteria bacterium]